ncbi:hypothetical protein ABZ434_30900 [Streptomyces sp. NPDC005761]|uniref:hypothetical protein n=1 Tax=unclassified Streptomyces TaxID=2593676 RepID=UPI00340D3B1C
MAGFSPLSAADMPPLLYDEVNAHSSQFNSSETSTRALASPLSLARPVGQMRARLRVFCDWSPV